MSVRDRANARETEWISTISDIKHANIFAHHCYLACLRARLFSQFSNRHFCMCHRRLCVSKMCVFYCYCFFFFLSFFLLFVVFCHRNYSFIVVLFTNGEGERTLFEPTEGKKGRRRKKATILKWTLKYTHRDKCMQIKLEFRSTFYAAHTIQIAPLFSFSLPRIRHCFRHYRRPTEEEQKEEEEIHLIKSKCVEHVMFLFFFSSA